MGRRNLELDENEKLEELRAELNILLANNDFSTTDEIIIAKSQELDKLVFVVQAKMCSNG